jgi:hypothetical protein
MCVYPPYMVEGKHDIWSSSCMYGGRATGSTELLAAAGDNGDIENISAFSVLVLFDMQSEEWVLLAGGDNHDFHHLHALVPER